MIKELFFLGQPVEFKSGIFIYPPFLRDVITNKHYNTYSRILTYSQEEIEDLYVEEQKDLTTFPTPLEFMLNNCYHSKQYEVICKRGFEFFIKTKDING